jgi:hypothetical protein
MSVDSVERQLEWAEVVELLDHHQGDHVQVAIGELGEDGPAPVFSLQGRLRRVEPDWFERSGVVAPESVADGRGAAFYVDGGQDAGNLPTLVLWERLHKLGTELLGVRGVGYMQGATSIIVTVEDEPGE